jgi:hypothetical protein
MARKAFVVLFGFMLVTMVAAESNRDVFNSWIGSHYSKLNGKFSGTVSYNGNSVTYDSSYTSTERRYVGPEINVGSRAGSGYVRNRDPWENYQVYHERWVTFYFDRNGIITNWRSYGW